MGNKRYRVLAVLWLVSLFSFLDRQVLAVLLEPIKAEFGLSDTQLGLLGGVAFGSFYAVFGLPIARLVDRFNRRNLLALSIFLWSGMTALCGAVGSFAGLFAARAGVAIGEAGGSPSTASLLSDYFAPRERARAFAVLTMAIPVSIMTGYILGGLLNDLYGWRMAFVAIGLPGVLVALLVLAVVREPVRGASENMADSGAIGLRDALGRLWSRRAYRHVALGGALCSMGTWGSGVWLPSFFVRVHGFTIGEAGTAVGLVFGLGGIVGTLGGGFLADWLATRTGDDRWYVRVPLIALAGAVPLAFGAFLAGQATTALILLACMVTLMHGYGGPHAALLQSLAEPRLRGLSVSVYNFVNNLVAMGIGPLFVGAISDIYGVSEGPAALRYAILAIVVIAYGGGAILLQLAQRHVRSDILTARAG